MDSYLAYGIIILVVICFAIQYHVFVTPEQLEKKHRQILDDVANKYVTMQMFTTFRESIKDDFKDLKSDIRELSHDIKELCKQKEVDER